MHDLIDHGFYHFLQGFLVGRRCLFEVWKRPADLIFDDPAQFASEIDIVKLVGTYRTVN